VILLPLNLTILKLVYLKSGFMCKKERYKHTKKFFTSLKFDFFRVQFKQDVEAVEFFLLSLPAPLEVSCFRVCFRVHTLGIFCFRFQLRIKLAVSLPLPAYFVKTLPLSSEFYRFQLPLPPFSK